MTLITSGWLWQNDDGPVSLADQLLKPRRRYRELFGKPPVEAFVNPSTVAVPTAVAGIVLKPLATVRPGMFLFPYEEVTAP